MLFHAGDFDTEPHIFLGEASVIAKKIDLRVGFFIFTFSFNLIGLAGIKDG